MPAQFMSRPARFRSHVLPENVHVQYSQKTVPSPSLRPPAVLSANVESTNSQTCSVPSSQASVLVLPSPSPWQFTADPCRLPKFSENLTREKEQTGSSSAEEAPFDAWPTQPTAPDSDS